MKTLSGTLTTEIAAAQSGWCECVEITLKSAITTPFGSTSVLRVTSNPGGLPSFLSNAWTFWPFKRDVIKGDRKTTNDKLGIAFSNVTGEWATMLDAVDWSDVPVTIYKVATSAGNDYVTLFTGLIDSASITLESIQFTVSNSLGSLSTVAPRENMHQNCRFSWADDQCTMLRYRTENYAAKTLDAACTTTRLKDTGFTEDTGTAASAIYDPQRVVYFEHPGLSNYTETTIQDVTRTESWPLTFQSGVNALGGTLTQYQHFDLASAYAKTASNFTPITGSQPACTVIAFLKRASGGAGRKGIITIGAVGAGNAVGIGYNAGSYEPYLGGAESWTTATQSNAVGDTWRSFAVTWPITSNVASFYVNAALINTETETRNFVAGPLTINAEPDGTDSDTVHKIGAVLVIPAALTLAQVKAVHNLFCAHYGLAAVS